MSQYAYVSAAYAGRILEGSTMAVIKQSEINAATRLTNALGQYSVVWKDATRITIQHDAPVRITVRAMLEAVNAWAVDPAADAPQIHYALEAIKRATCAILDRPGSIHLDAPITFGK